jgi:hypothetical protein
MISRLNDDDGGIITDDYVSELISGKQQSSSSAMVTGIELNDARIIQYQQQQQQQMSGQQQHQHLHINSRRNNTEFHGNYYSSNRMNYKYSQTIMRPKRSYFVEYVEYCYTTMLSMSPLLQQNDDDKDAMVIFRLDKVLIRTRWLLILYHSFVLCEMPYLSSIIGIDTLRNAIDMVTSIIILQDTLSASSSSEYHSTTTTPSTAFSNYLSSSSSSSVAVDVLNKLNVISRTNISSSIRKLYYHALEPLSPNNLMEFIVDTFYSQAISSTIISNKLRCIFNFHCSRECFDPNSTYLLHGRVSLPSTLDPIEVQSFLKHIRQLHDEEGISMIEMIDQSLTEANSQAFNIIEIALADRIYDRNNRFYAKTAITTSISTIMGSSKSKAELSLLRAKNENRVIVTAGISSCRSSSSRGVTVTSSSSLSSLLLIMNHRSYIQSVQDVMKAIRDMLPSLIDFNDHSIKLRMIEHTNTIGSRNTGPAASSSSVIVAVPSALHHPRHPPPKAHAPLSTIPHHQSSSNSNNNSSSGSSYDLRRRAAQRIVVKLFTREFDPLWAYAMSEAQYYNEVVMKLTNEANELMKAGSNLCQHLINHHRGLCDDIHSIRHVMSVINTLQNGFTPKQWLQRSSSASISGLIGDSSVYGCNNTSSSSSDHSLSRLKLEDWIQQLTERRNFLYDWLSVGNPGMIKLHLLQNPEGLFYALRETYAMRKSIISIDMVICKYQLFDMEKISTTNHNHRDDMTILSKSNYGCNVMIGDVVLYNGSYDEKGEALEFLPDHSALNVGKVRRDLYSIVHI